MVNVFQATVLPVFIASPGDLPAERDVVVQQINVWNRNHSVREHVAFVPVAWEWAVAAQGGGGQQQINQQQVRQADVIIAMFKSRLGMATNGHPSGTAEEISVGTEIGADVGVLICKKPEGPGVYEGEEYTRMLDYLKQLRTEGLTQDFNSDAELRDGVDRILWKAARDRVPGGPSMPTTSSSASACEAINSSMDRSPARLLDVEIDRICSNAATQGWLAKKTETALRLRHKRRKKSFTFPIDNDDPQRCREDLRRFAGQLRANGLRVSESVHAPLKHARS